MSGVWGRIERDRDALAEDLAKACVPTVPSVPVPPLLDDGDEWELDQGWLDGLLEADWDEEEGVGLAHIPYSCVAP